MMHIHSVSQYDKYVRYYERDSMQDQEEWQANVAHVVPKTHTTIPCVVAEFSDGSLMYIGGVDQFVRKLGCPMKD